MAEGAFGTFMISLPNLTTLLLDEIENLKQGDGVEDTKGP